MSGRLVEREGMGQAWAASGKIWFRDARVDTIVIFVRDWGPRRASAAARRGEGGVKGRDAYGYGHGRSERRKALSSSCFTSELAAAYKDARRVGDT